MVIQQLKKYPNMEIVASQTGEFLRTKGQTVMEQLIQSNPEIDAVYAENDEMRVARPERNAEIIAAGRWSAADSQATPGVGRTPTA